MKKYQELKHNAPKLKTKYNAREVIFKTVSCMCDNVNYFRFKKDNNNEFKLDCMGFCYSNFQIPSPKYSLEWNADDNNWNEVINLINSGTSLVESVQSR
jgi:hypothetical protein